MKYYSFNIIYFQQFQAVTCYLHVQEKLSIEQAKTTESGFSRIFFSGYLLANIKPIQ